jgi:glycopeptide antibiotics resistance protein
VAGGGLRRVPLWVWWIALTWLISLPWRGFTLEPQWSRVHWIPFTDPADRPRDFVLNVLFFVPFGYSFGRTRRWHAVALIAALVSLSAEATQLFGTVRYPSATDVTAAVIGAVLGALFARRTQPSGEVGPSNTP